MLGAFFGARVTPPEGVPDDVVIRQGRWVTRLGGWLAGGRAPAGAVTLGRTIIVHPAQQLSPRLLRHELAHVEQWRREPLTFPLRYIWQHLRHGYRDNPYEVAARAAERNETIRHGDAA